jgi:hypothetical protein
MELTRHHQMCLSKEIYIHTRESTNADSIHKPKNFVRQFSTRQTAPTHATNRHMAYRTYKIDLQSFFSSSMHLMKFYDDHIVSPSHHLHSLSNDCFLHQHSACSSCLAHSCYMPASRFLTDCYSSITLEILR